MSPSYSVTGASSSWTMYEPVPDRLTCGSAAAGVWSALAAFTATGAAARAATIAVATRIA
jgi:hypothetical protein